MIILPKVPVIRIGDTPEVIRRSGVPIVACHKFGGTLRDDRLQKEEIDQSENSGIRADTQSQNQDSDCRESGILPQHSQTVADISPKISHSLLLDCQLGYTQSSYQSAAKCKPFEGNTYDVCA